MSQKILLIIIIFFLTFACGGKKEVSNSVPTPKDQSYKVYQQAIDAMNEGDFFFASKKFLEAETIMPKIEMSAKASLMASYCFYSINFYEDALKNLELYIKKYPAGKNIPYAHYLIALSYYEQILDEEKDILPLLVSKEKMEFFIKKYPNTDYGLDLKFKLDLINNQLAAKELYVAKYYITTKKWIAAINRLKIIVSDYSETIFIEEALHRLVEVYFLTGLEKEAKTTAALLGYNYKSSEWYAQSYKILNKSYKIPKKKEIKKDEGLLKKTIKMLTKQ